MAARPTLWFCLQPAGRRTRGHAGCLRSHLIGDLACIVLDGELRQWHLGLRVEWVGAMVVVALLQECVVCGLRGREMRVEVGGAGHLLLALSALLLRVLEKNGSQS